MRYAAVALVALLLMGLGVDSVIAQEDAAPAVAPAVGVTADVAKITGTAKVRRAGQDAWAPATVGLKLAQSDMVFTGRKSTLSLKIGRPDFTSSLVVVKPLTTMTVTKLSGTQDTIETILALKQGVVRAGVTTGVLRTDFKVATPMMVAGVTGTEIKEVSHSPDLGSSVTMGDEGSLGMKGSHGARSDLDAHQMDTDELILAVAQQHRRRISNITPTGMTDEENTDAIAPFVYRGDPVEKTGGRDPLSIFLIDRHSDINSSSYPPSSHENGGASHENGGGSHENRGGYP